MGHPKLKKLLCIGLLATLPLSVAPTWADDVHPASKDKKPAMVMSDKEKQEQMSKMQENMLKMHDHMHKIMQATDSKEREKLMQEHMKMMHDAKQMMRGMKGGMKGGEMMDH